MQKCYYCGCRYDHEERHKCPHCGKGKPRGPDEPLTEAEL